MATRLPRATVAFQKFTNSQLETYAIAIRNGLIASVVTFPTPPILPAALLTLINTYHDALAASIDGSKQQRAAMHEARFALKNALRVDAAYVNQIISNLISGGTSYDDAQTLILGTGYELSKDPVIVGSLPVPVIRTHSSPNIGQLYVLADKVVGAKAYQVIIGPTGTPIASWKTYVLPTTRMKISNLTSAQSYDFRVAAVGSDYERNYTTAYTQVII